MGEQNKNTGGNNKCKLCGKEANLQKHHLIPKCVIKAVQETPTEVSNMVIKVCPDCHRKIHESFLDHLQLSGDVHGFEGMDVYGCMKYHLIKDFLKARHHTIYLEWRNYLKEFVANVFTEMDKEG
jgi:hypothetical protein